MDPYFILSRSKFLAGDDLLWCKKLPDEEIIIGDFSTGKFKFFVPVEKYARFKSDHPKVPKKMRRKNFSPGKYMKSKNGIVIKVEPSGTTSGKNIQYYCSFIMKNKTSESINAGCFVFYSWYDNFIRVDPKKKVIPGNSEIQFSFSFKHDRYKPYIKIQYLPGGIEPGYDMRDNVLTTDITLLNN